MERRSLCLGKLFLTLGLLQQPIAFSLMLAIFAPLSDALFDVEAAEAAADTIMVT